MTAERSTFRMYEHSQGFYFPPDKGGGVWLFGFYTNKQTNKNKLISRVDVFYNRVMVIRVDPKEVHI